jgi:hypothetical protein
MRRLRASAFTTDLGNGAQRTCSGEHTDIIWPAVGKFADRFPANLIE